MFNNENDLLEIRLNILNNYVDYFVIIESSETHSGLKKKLVFDIKNYPEFKDKIIYGVINKFPHNLTAWQKENYQRNPDVRARRSLTIKRFIENQNH